MNNKITKKTFKDVKKILELDTKQLFNLSDEELNDISTKLKQVDKNIEKEQYAKINLLKLTIQQELYKRLKIGKYAFSISNKTNLSIVSADYIFNKMRMKQLIRTKELQILENWLDEKAELQNFKAYYSLSTNSNLQTKTYYFTFDKVLEKINNSYSKKGSKLPLIDIPLLFNQKDVFELLKIPRARFERENLKDYIGYYQLNISKKIAVMYSFDDLYEFNNFWNYYKQYYIEGNVVKRKLSTPLKVYFEKFNNLSFKEKEKYQTPYNEFMDRIKQLG